MVAVAMRARLRSIDTGDDRDWRDVADSVPDPWKAAGVFFATVGSENSAGGDLFEVCVATPAAKHLALGSDGNFHGLIIDHMDATSVQTAMKEHIEAVEADDWKGLVWELSKFARWEYAGMDTAGEWP
ncbi:MAG: Imm8 family immunity protein [Planctomycetota bacterium]